MTKLSSLKLVRWGVLRALPHRNLSYDAPAPHLPVLCKEAVSMLTPSADNVLIDMTFGAGGHTKAILEKNDRVKIICLDRDPSSYQRAVLLSKELPQITPCLGKFSDLPKILKDLRIKPNSIDGIIFDFGCSSMQMDSAERGFSLSKDGPLDMRMDPSIEITGADVIAHSDETDLYQIFKKYGQEKKARKIARAIVEARYRLIPLQTTSQLADVVKAISLETRQDKLQRPAHVATKVFQALRIFVNDELNEINCGLFVSHKYLKIGGRLVTVSFHSLEDTIVKRHLTGHLEENVINPLPLKYSSHEYMNTAGLNSENLQKNWMLLNKHVIVPSEEEVSANPRSRSAKLRAAVRIR